jgi:hypothetical protein
MKLAPNFEVAMYLAQATGSYIVTDNSFRWGEITRARRRPKKPQTGLTSLVNSIESSAFAFPREVLDIATFDSNTSFAAYPALMRDVFKYLSNIEDRGPRPNWEAHLNARFAKAQGTTA